MPIVLAILVTDLQMHASSNTGGPNRPCAGLLSALPNAHLGLATVKWPDPGAEEMFIRLLACRVKAMSRPAAVVQLVHPDWVSEADYK